MRNRARIRDLAEDVVGPNERMRDDLNCAELIKVLSEAERLKSHTFGLRTFLAVLA